MSLSDDEDNVQISSTTHQLQEDEDSFDNDGGIHVQHIEGHNEEGDFVESHVILEEHSGISGLGVMEPDQSNMSVEDDDTAMAMSVHHVAAAATDEESLELGAEAANCTEQLMQTSTLAEEQEREHHQQQQQASEVLGSLDVATLQSLLSAGQLVDLQGQPIQVVTVGGNQGDVGNKIWQLIQTGQPGVEGGGLALVAINQEQANDAEDAVAQQLTQNLATIASQAEQQQEQADSGLVFSLLPTRAPVNETPLPPNCPDWASRLRNCENIGDFYRGWVETEVELDLLLTFHKQQTGSIWGTRQSPSAGKPSTRLMWKSQYVPFDGIPFVNAGSRAIVMECQFGPRRKGGFSVKKAGQVNEELRNNFKQTCPARIYIKRVRKFPEFRVQTSLDKKNLKLAMDKSFHMLKEKGMSTPGLGEERWYVQLPTEKAHEFHEGDAGPPTSSQPQPPLATTLNSLMAAEQEMPSAIKNSRLNPAVAQKVRAMVAAGETRLYAIRKALRRFVEKEMSLNYVPEKHNLQYFPTVNDLQNHIHQAIKDIEAGILPITAQTVNVEVVTSGDPGGGAMAGGDHMWAGGAAGDGGSTHAETVTVTLTQKPGQDGSHVISRVETKLSDGTTRITNSLTPETARLLAKLHPNMFPPETLMQLQTSSGSSKSPASSLLGSTAGLTLLHSGSGSGVSGHGGELASTPTGGVILPSGDIHSGQNGIYTVIPSENSSLLFANPGGGGNSISTATTQLNGFVDEDEDSSSARQLVTTDADGNLVMAAAGDGAGTLVTSEGHLVTSDGHYVTADGHYVTADGDIVSAEELGLVADDGEIVTKQEQDSAAEVDGGGGGSGQILHISHEQALAMQDAAAAGLLDQDSGGGMMMAETEGGGYVLMGGEGGTGFTLKLENAGAELSGAATVKTVRGLGEDDSGVAGEMEGISVDAAHLAALGITHDQLDSVAKVKLEQTDSDGVGADDDEEEEEESMQ